MELLDLGKLEVDVFGHLMAGEDRLMGCGEGYVRYNFGKGADLLGTAGHTVEEAVDFVVVKTAG